GLLLVASLTGCGGSSRSGSFASIAPATSVTAPVASSGVVSTTPASVTSSIAGAAATTAPPITGTFGSGPATAPPTTTSAPAAPPAATTSASATPPVTASAPFQRIVLGLDGLPYRVMADLQRRGRFKDFHPASRMIAPFPSLSNISWASLMDIGPEAGYQAV